MLKFFPLDKNQQVTVICMNIKCVLSAENALKMREGQTPLEQNSGLV